MVGCVGKCAYLGAGDLGGRCRAVCLLGEGCSVSVVLCFC